jgi:hypothetical protein
MSHHCHVLPADATPEDRAYWRARRRVRALRSWYSHALVYACVNGAVWLMYTLQPWASHDWHGWPGPLKMTLGWGLALLIHGVVVWTRTSTRGREWESRKIEQYVRQDLASGPAPGERR